MSNVSIQGNERRESINAASGRTSEGLPRNYSKRFTPPSEDMTPKRGFSATPPTQPVEYTNTTPQTPTTQRRLPPNAFERRLPPSRLAARVRPSRKSDVSPSRKPIKGISPEKEAAARRPIAGTTRRMDGTESKDTEQLSSDEESAADTKVLISRNEDDQSHRPKAIDWMTYHKYLTVMSPSRTDLQVSTFARGKSINSLDHNIDDISNLFPDGEVTPRCAKQNPLSQPKGPSRSALPESHSHHRKAEAARSLDGRSHDTSSGEQYYECVTNNSHIRQDPDGVDTYPRSAQSDRTVTNSEDHSMNGIYYVVREKPISLTKLCKCASGKTFKRCCMAQIRKEAEGIYGDLDTLVSERGVIFLDLGSSTQMMYDQEDANEKAKIERIKQARKITQELRESNTTYRSRDQPIAPDQSCLCGSNIPFKACCMPGFKEGADEQHVARLPDLGLQHQIGEVEIGIDDLDEVDSTQSEETVTNESRSPRLASTTVAAKSDADDNTSSQVNIPPSTIISFLTHHTIPF